MIYRHAVALGCWFLAFTGVELAPLPKAQTASDSSAMCSTTAAQEALPISCMAVHQNLQLALPQVIRAMAFRGVAKVRKDSLRHAVLEGSESELCIHLSTFFRVCSQRNLQPSSDAWCWEQRVCRMQPRSGCDLLTSRPYLLLPLSCWPHQISFVI